MDISHRGADYEVPKASVDGEPHEMIVLVAVCAGAILASIILLILVAMIERAKNKESEIPQNVPPSPVPSPSFYSQPAEFNRSISTLSDRVSTASEKSYCSGVIINGQVHCCQKALEKATSSSGISSSFNSTDTLNVSKLNQELDRIDRETKMTKPKRVTIEEIQLHEVVTRF